MSNERIIEKIKKCLALAENNSSNEEAAAAALQAQKLMAQYNIEAADVENEVNPDKEEVKIVTVEVENLTWKFKLAQAVADNFKCKTFSYGAKTVAFYGHQTDAKIAKEVFSFLLKYGHKLAMKERARVKKETGSGEGAYGSFVLGFLSGIKEKLAAQSTALMIVVPQDVKESYTEFISGAKTRNIGVALGRMDKTAYENGKVEGRSAMGSREIAAN